MYFSKSDTSGEKSFEEFYTDEENVDLKRFSSLGVITDKPLIDSDKISDLFSSLNAAFQDEDIMKDKIVEIIGRYLPYFEHIEKGKSLDRKM